MEEVGRSLSQNGVYTKEANWVLFETSFVRLRHYGHFTAGAFPRHGSYREIYRLTGGTPGGRRCLVESQEIAGRAGGWNWAKNLTEELCAAMYDTGLMVD